MYTQRIIGALLIAAVLCPGTGHAFCGFYVASGDAKLFNRSSKVALVRDGDHTVVTMANDFQGEPKEFAIVVPVPAVLEKGQIHIAEGALLEHLDAYSAPRLVEFFDPDPCPKAEPPTSEYQLRGVMAMEEVHVRGGRSDEMKVVVEARYTVGEYDILILSAKESRALEHWLVDHHYRIPPGAERVLDAYIKQDMKFFVAKVNLKEQQKLGFKALRPIQIAYESPKFMLPIRLGMVNADGPQELFVYAITPQGRVEPTNYRGVKLPSGMDVPAYVKEQFADFYRAMFAEQVRRQNMSVMFTEYAWDMSGCDPCASEPLSNQELEQLGVAWLDEHSEYRAPSGSVFITRLHARYDRAHFPEDLVFQVTPDRESFQGRYVIRHEWTGDASCAQARDYRAKLPRRREREAHALAELTGWRADKIRGTMGLDASWSKPEDQMKWWDRLWKR